MTSANGNGEDSRPIPIGENRKAVLNHRTYQPTSQTVRYRITLANTLIASSKETARHGTVDRIALERSLRCSHPADAADTKAES